MTAEEIRNHEFEQLSEDSYSKESVDAYIREVGKAYDELFNENKEIVRRLTIFAKKLDEYKRNENYMTETLLTAQKTAAQTISGAEAVVAKMIEAAKNEGKKIVNEARERSNAIYADRDKIIADAQKIADELTEKAENAYEDARADAEKQMQSVIDEINGNADSVIRDAEAAGEIIIEEAKSKAQAIADGIIADANKFKADAETLRNESFEMKKLAVLYKDEIVAKASEEAELQKQEAKAFAYSVTSKAKSAAVGILLRAQANANKINDELDEKTEAANNALAVAQQRCVDLKAAAQEVSRKLSSKIVEFNTVIADIPTEKDLLEIEIDKSAFVADTEALNAAVADENIDAVLKCFGINSDEMMKATEQIVAAETEKIKAEAAQEKENHAESEENAEKSDDVLTDTAVSESDKIDMPEVSEISSESASDELSQEEGVSENGDNESDDLADDFDFNFDDAERIPEAGEEVDYIDIDDEPAQVTEAEIETEVSADENDEIVDDFSIDTDALFDDNWDEISEFEEDDVKEFVPEIPGENDDKPRFIMDDEPFGEDKTDDEIGIGNEAESASSEPLDDNFEIDFSMFEVDETKKKEPEPKNVNKNGKKKKKKKK